MPYLETVNDNANESARPRNGPQVSDPLETEDEVRTLLFNRISWGAVLAGVMVALVTQLILNLIGIGIGAASFDPTSNANPSGSTFSIAAGIWWALSGILAALAGGYTAGRLSGRPTETSAPGTDLPFGRSRRFSSSTLCPPA